MAKEMEGRYNPKDFEQRIYDLWMDKEYFKAEANSGKPPYTIVLPPPNITGQLHMGHALDHTLQDILIRWKRMQGFESLWLPGTDHASIATEVRVLDKIREDEGITKEELGRERFLERAWDWKEEYGNRIVEQMKKLGNSCDWSRERFTMDEGCNEAVTEVFIRLFNKGLIYRGYRLINWCPDCKTSLSDAEVEHEEKQGNFWHIKYYLKDSDTFIEIATTRPETMLGDTAIAVHPEDERFKQYIGQTVILPILNKEIPIVADDYVDMETGTGALKVTPAHDPNDFEIGKRHDLEQLIVMNEDATMNKNAGKFEGMDRYDCRKAIVKELKENDLLVEIKAHDHNVGTCYRCHTVVEPMLSDQWFVAMEELAKPALEVIKTKETEFVPERFTKIYNHWLENIRDWCISRQLWWGHRIPAYYCQSCPEIAVGKEMPDTCSACGGTEFKQDEDVLDTWFSSALWPFSTLGWPNQTEDLKYFYPTDVLVTGYDIIFFWVVRMVFSALEQMDEVPFKYTYVHGLVRDSQGRKMSKSLGNGVDPLEVIDQYGADALRFMLATGNSPGADQKFQLERVESSRNFANKLWNASRFVIMGMEDEDLQFDGNEQLETSDRWILSRMNTVISEVTHNLDRFDLGVAANKIYEFVWNEYCDWYIELAKKRLYGEDEEAKRTVKKVLLTVLKEILKMLHPFMPFITEEIWQHLPNHDQAIIISDWPIADGNFISDDIEKEMDLIMDAIRSLRNVRAEMDVPPSKKASLMVLADERVKGVIERNAEYINSLAAITEVTFISDKNEAAEDAVIAVIDGAEMFLPLDELIDFKKELERLEKEKTKLEKEVQRVVQKLNNQGFISKAPEKLVEAEKAKKDKYAEMLEKVEERIEAIQVKLG